MFKVNNKNTFNDVIVTIVVFLLTFNIFRTFLVYLLLTLNR